MSLVVVARYVAYPEALVARGALNSAGIPAVIADEGYGTVNPLMQAALQGFRLCVPASELEVSRDILRVATSEAASAEASDIVLPPRTRGWTGAAVLATLLSPYFGLAVEATRRRPSAARYAFIGGFPAMLVLLGWLALTAE